MPITAFPGLFKLPKRQRLEIAERLWLSAADEGEMPVPEEHRRILNERMANYRSGKGKVISHQDLMRRVRSA